MRERLKALRQVLRVHELIEEMREAESQRAIAEVLQVEHAIGTERRIALIAAQEGRNALLDGDRMRWSFTTAQKETAERGAVRLAPVLSEREQHSRVVRELHFDSRQWSEKLKQLVERVEVKLKEIEGRRMQAEADDRYLSRKRWRQKGKGDDRTQMSAS